MLLRGSGNSKFYFYEFYFKFAWKSWRYPNSGLTCCRWLLDVSANTWAFKAQPFLLLWSSIPSKCLHLHLVFRSPLQQETHPCYRSPQSIQSPGLFLLVNCFISLSLSRYPFTSPLQPDLQYYLSSGTRSPLVISQSQTLKAHTIMGNIKRAAMTSTSKSSTITFGFAYYCELYFPPSDIHHLISCR